MKSLLEKISWKTRNLNFKFRFLDIYLHDENGTWGFEFFTIQYNFKAYSLLAFLCRLPNKTHVQKFVIDDWDFFFLERPLFNIWQKLNERITWGFKLSKIETLKYQLLNLIFK